MNTHFSLCNDSSILHIFVDRNAVFLFALDQGSRNYGLWSKSAPLPVSVDKALLAQSHAHYLCITYCCLHAARTELNICHTDHMAYKTPNIYYLALYKKSADPF